MKCIFCRIVAGKAHCHKIYENRQFLAFLDIKPLRRGHVLIIPKKHYRWVYEVPQFGGYFEFVRRIMLAQKRAFRAESVSIGTVGYDVAHAHVHTIPRLKGEKGFVKKSNVKNISHAEMEKIAARIRRHIRK